MSEFLIILSVTLSCFFTIFLLVFTHLQNRKMMEYVHMILKDIMQVLQPPRQQYVSPPTQQPYIPQPVSYQQEPPLPYKLPSDIKRID